MTTGSWFFLNRLHILIRGKISHINASSHFCKNSLVLWAVALVYFRKWPIAFMKRHFTVVHQFIQCFYCINHPLLRVISYVIFLPGFHVLIFSSKWHYFWWFALKILEGHSIYRALNIRISYFRVLYPWLCRLFRKLFL